MPEIVAESIDDGRSRVYDKDRSFCGFTEKKKGERRNC